jgi:hypothetical protein
MVKSNQRITKIKRDPIEELLKKAEATPVENACTIQPQGMDLTPYPDMNSLRLWVHDYLLNGLNATYVNNIDASGQTYLTTIVDGLPLFTKLTKSSYPVSGLVDFNQPTLDSNGVIGGASFAVTADSEVESYSINTSKVTTHGSPQFTPATGVASGFSTSDYYTLPASTQSTDGTTYVFEFTPTEPVNDLQRIAHFEFVLALEIQANGGPLISYCWDTGSSDVILDSVTPNTTYRVKIQITSNKYRIVSLWQNNEWVEKINQYDPGIELSNNSYILHIGTGSVDQTRPLTDGTINMYNSYYYIDTEPDALYRFAEVSTGTLAYMATNPDTGYWQPNSDTTNHYIEYYNPEAIKLSSIEFNNYLCTDSNYIPTNFIIQGSNTGDASDWINIQTIENSNTTVGTNSPYSFNVSTQYSYKYFRIYINSPQSIVQIGYMKLVGTIERSQVPVEITKPGLWLSNLCKPYQVSYAGGWLRQNLINHSNKEFDTINSDTIGNYSFSFFQRGIIHRDAGSTHSDNDSYCQHWSPSALGCISHDSIIIPTNNLRNTYSSYQTLAVPSNVNMQYYSETPSKDVKFTFVDNNDSIPLTTTSFNGRVVGDGWTFEYLVSGNHQGSGTWNPDAGCDCDAETVNCEECPHCWSCVSEDIRNSGLCITGEIKYQNADGTVCIQAVNECFQTIQASLQPDNPNKGNNTLSTYEVVGYEVTTGCRRYTPNESGAPTEIICDYGLPSCNNSKGCSFAMIGCPSGAYGANWAEWELTGSRTGYSIVGINGNFSPENYIDQASSYCDYAVKPGGGIREGYVQVAIRYYGVSEEQLKQPQSNVNIYFCVTDEKKKQEAQDIPWNYTCGLVDRFSVSFSTTQCEDDYTKSYLVAENVSISALGDITGFNEN